MEKQNWIDLSVTGVRSVSTIYTAEQASARRNVRSCWAIVYKWEGETEYSAYGRKAVDLSAVASARSRFRLSFL